MLAGGPIAWKPNLQPSATLSSMEAEYVALSAATREAKWPRQLVAEIGFPSADCTIAGEHNQGCTSTCNNSRTDVRTTHIDVKHHCVCEMIESGRVELKYVPTEQMIAGVCVITERTAAPKFKSCARATAKPMDTSLRGRARNQSDVVDPEQAI